MSHSRNRKKPASFKVEVYYPHLMSKVKVETYKSLREASKDLNTTYYFLYNCYHKKHNNQFSKFYRISRINAAGNELCYRPPKKHNQRSLHDDDDGDDDVEHGGVDSSGGAGSGGGDESTETDDDDDDDEALSDLETEETFEYSATEQVPAGGAPTNAAKENSKPSYGSTQAEQLRVRSDWSKTEDTVGGGSNPSGCDQSGWCHHWQSWTSNI